jgi:hypothetical protein
MKKVSGATIKGIGPDIDSGDSNSIEVITRTELAKVAQAFIILQQARHDADYNLEEPLDPADALAQVNRANSAFRSWETPTSPRTICFLCFSKRKSDHKAAWLACAGWITCCITARARPAVAAHRPAPPLFEPDLTNSSSSAMSVGSYDHERGGAYCGSVPITSSRNAPHFPDIVAELHAC